MLSAHDFGEYKSYKDEYSPKIANKTGHFEKGHMLINFVVRVEHAKSKIIVLEGLI